MKLQKDNLITIKNLSHNTDYYNNVFKKTEKIVSAIFYILSKTNTDQDTEAHKTAIKDRVVKTHEMSLETLLLQQHDQSIGLQNFQHGLVALQSTLTVAQVAQVVPKDVYQLLNEQIDAVLRYINNHFLINDGISVEDLTETIITKKQPVRATKTQTVSTGDKQRRVSIPAGDISSDAYLVYSQLTDRAERIKTVLEAKPQATIKDIAEVITDVSEKTIQRELNSLIEKGQVLREGERRWSRYSVLKK